MMAKNWMMQLGFALAVSFSAPAAIAQTKAVKR
jgi:hypothetical protein